MISNVIKLYYSPYSPPARGAYMVIKALKLNVNLKEVKILTKEYLKSDLLKINPQHTVPTLQDGDFVIWDSHVIATYLASKYGGNSNLYPTSLTSRAIVDQRLYFDTEHLFPKVHQIIHPLLFRGKTTIPKVFELKVKESYEILEKFLKNSLWLAGNNLTIADLCCISSISTLNYLIPIVDTEHPLLRLYIEKCKALPYYKEANQKGLDNLALEIQERLIHTYVRSLSIKS